ncbi:MAG: hypothetical protein HS129_00580 [Leptospiraceae bacterium]|nr:hypothetical protein [Leptospiraceae bacterium]
MKIHVCLSSKALFNLNGKIEIHDLIRQIIQRGGTFSRIDLSQDDYDGYLNLPEILEKLKNQEVSTRFRGFLKVELFNPFSLWSLSWLSFRDPKSRKTVRPYILVIGIQIFL